MKTLPTTPSGMKSAQRAFDATEDPGFYDLPRRRRNRTIMLWDGSEVSDADVESDPAPRENDED